MSLLFYARLIGLTAGTLVYLFLIALILGHRRPRFFERLLFFLTLSLFLTYASRLLEVNAKIAYGTPPAATQFVYSILSDLGMGFLPALLVHIHFAYVRSIQRRAISRWYGAMVWVFYAFPILEVASRMIVVRDYLRYVSVSGVMSWLATWSESDLVFAVLICALVEIGIAKSSIERVERRFFVWLGGISVLAFILLALREGVATIPPLTGDGTATALICCGILPGVLLIYFALRHNFLEYGAQRNLVYALSATFLALLYLALVRRVGTWLEPVLPPEATASFLLFVLIFLFEPLERVIGPVLHRGMRERMSRVQRLSVELQQESRHGSVSHLVAEAERRIREEFGLAAVRLAVPRDPALAALESPGGLGHVAQIRLMKDGQEVGLLEAASTGSYLTGETTAALEFLAEQLPGMLDLAGLIEDKLRLERELADRERMASLGQMAANVSHNLRNPLSSMKTVLQVQLENPELPLDVRRDCALVVNEIDRMSAKLTQLLRYAKPSTNGQRVAAVALANQTAVLFRHDAEQRNVRLEFERPTVEIFAVASEDGLSEVLSNLIVNALEAQPEGGRVRVSLARTDGRLEIIVDDDGPGISPELRAKIFQPYFTTKATGTGLGLSIVARRIDEMGGTMAYESPLRGGQGTRFRLTLPLAEGEGA
ncbi:MAG: ATP-binding protein [Candidatus Acidiferrales bacterium]